MTDASSREIGGYLQMETYEGRGYYPDLYAFNLARCAITWFFSAVKARKIWLPHFLCGSVIDAIEECHFSVSRYSIGRDFLPDPASLPAGPLDEGEWILILNNYGQLSDSAAVRLQKKYENVLFDYTHAFFQRPLAGTNVVYSVRKFLGVTDGAYLSTSLSIPMPKKTDESHTRFLHMLGRYERTASEFYGAMLDNAHSYEGASVMKMSPVTENLLRSFDYTSIASRRTRNFQVLDRRLGFLNPLREQNLLRVPESGPFCYPFYCEDGIRVRRALAASRIYVPTYWSNVIRDMPENSIEYKYAANILAIPCDQRYQEKEMNIVADTLRDVIRKEVEN